jgi:hypothetical protein
MTAMITPSSRLERTGGGEGGLTYWLGAGTELEELPDRDVKTARTINATIVAPSRIGTAVRESWNRLTPTFTIRPPFFGSLE